MSDANTARDHELLALIAEVSKSKPAAWTPPEVAEAAVATALRQACDALEAARIAAQVAGYGNQFAQAMEEAIGAANYARRML